MKGLAVLALLLVLPAVLAEPGTLLDALQTFLAGLTGAQEASAEVKHWALLVAGSAGYGNYRHQADVAHAYQLLKAAGLQDEHIIVMMADDVPYSFENPFPGELYNRPGGPNVYKGLKPDYTGFRVTAANFLAVLAGDEKKLEPGAEGGRVLTSGPTDRVFVYYADHGAPGILGMPSGPFLYADQLITTLEKKNKHKGFSEMVMFIEACESGSMFEGLLNAELPIYVTTAANAHESSWGTYCPGMSPSPPPEFTTCLGDLYSVAWMEEVDALMMDDDALSHETLLQLYTDVRKRTSANYTYRMGSHVMQYGNLKIAEEMLSEVLEEASLQPSTSLLPPWLTLLAVDEAGAGKPLAGTNATAAAAAAAAANGGDGAGVLQQAVEARDAELLHLWAKWDRAEQGSADRAQAKQALDVELSRRRRADKLVRDAVRSVVKASNSAGTLQMMFAEQLRAQEAGASTQAASNTLLPEALVLASLPEDERLTELIVASPPGTAVPGRPVVQDWECLRGMVSAWEGACGPMDGYSMKHTRALATMCEAGVGPASMSAAFGAACAAADIPSATMAEA